MDEKENKVRERIAATLLEDVQEITIDIKPYFRTGFLYRIEQWIRKRTKHSKTFFVYPLVPGALIRVTQRLSKINYDDTVFDDKDHAFHFSVDAVNKYKDDIIYMVACVLWGKKSKPPKKLIRFLDAQCNAQDLYRLMTVVLNSMGIQDFFRLMVSVGKMNILKPEKSTSGPLSEDSRNTLKETTPGMKSSGSEAGQT